MVSEQHRRVEHHRYIDDRLPAASRRAARVTIAMLAMSAICSLPNAGAQPVRGRVQNVGFRASTDTGNIVRAGQWFPILAVLDVPGNQVFQGGVHCETTDLDGDLLSIIRVPVTVTPGAGGRRVWCYGLTPTIDRIGDRLAKQPRTLVVVDEAGTQVGRLPLPDYEVIDNDALLILDISAQPVTRLRQLQTAGWSPGDRGLGRHPFYQNVVVAQMPARELPDEWFGLEAVDVIVWDLPNPHVPNVTPVQLEALLKWVRRGGRLVVGIGASWSRIADSPLRTVLPVQWPPAGASDSVRRQPPTRDVRRLDRFLRGLADKLWQSDRSISEKDLDGVIAVAGAKARPGALTLWKDEADNGSDVDLIVVDFEGSGRVVSCAAGLRDLSRMADPVRFFSKFIDLNPTDPEFLEKEVQSTSMQLGMQQQTLYPGVVQPISFSGKATVIILIALLFVAGYAIMSTFVSWYWLKALNRLWMSWPVFVGCAVVAAVLSVGLVGVTRGFPRLETMSFVDLEANSPLVRTTSYYGYRRPLRAKIDLGVGGEDGFLRPLAHPPDRRSYYATPQRYVADPVRGRLLETPMRATLKQFEGCWEGTLDGTIRTQLVVDASSGKLSENSWIENGLETDFVGGYLLFNDPRHPALLRRGAATQTTSYDGRVGVPTAANVLSVRIGGIPAGRRTAGQLGSEEYDEHTTRLERWQRRNADPENKPQLPTLFDRQVQWVRSGSLLADWQRDALDINRAASLLASTRAFYAGLERDAKDPGLWLSTAAVMDVDVSHWLLPGYGILLLFADESGPSEFLAGETSVQRRGGRALYRIRVPIEIAPRVGGTQP